MKNLITYLKALWSWVSGSQRKKIGVTLGEGAIEHPFSTYSAPFGTCWQPSGKLHSVVRCAAMFVMLFILGSGNVWGADSEWSHTFTAAGTVTITSNATTLNGKSWSIATTTGKGSPTCTSVENGYSKPGWKFGSSKDNYYSSVTLSTSAFSSYKVKSVTIIIRLNGGVSTTVAVSQGATNIGSNTINTSGTWHTLTANTTAGTSGNVSINISTTQAFFINSISVTYEAADCGVDPTIGNPTLTSIASGTMTVSCPTISAGTNCTISDYGFVWVSGGSDPIISNNKTQVGTNNQSTAFSKALSISFTTGTTYKIKAYATNGHGTSLSTTSLTVIPRSITFDSNGGSSVATKYVNSGTAATAPTAPTKTGYNFANWCTTSGLDVDVNWSSAISENKTYYAKWTAKTTTVSFNQNSGTGGQTTSKTATYGQAMPTPITTPTREGYDFGGYYDGSGGTGTQYYTETGASARNWDKEAATTTLYAKWTIKTYTVTWMVNNTTYSAGGSTSVNHGSRVSTLPTAPDPGDYCGDKFVGWTDAAGGAYVHGTSNLYTTASGFPNATGNQTFYAVFADYDD